MGGWGNCWTFATPLWVAYGGRLIIRKSRLAWPPHVMWSPADAKLPEPISDGDYWQDHYLVVERWSRRYWAGSIAGVEVWETKPVEWVRRALERSRVLRWIPFISTVFPYTVRHGIGEAKEDD